MARKCPYQNCEYVQLSNDDRSCPACGRPVYFMGSHDYTVLIVDRTRDFTGREWVLAQIDAWLADPAGARVFFLGGGPGSGKSAVAARLIQLTRGEAPTGACPYLVQTGLAYYHFCQAQYNDVIEPVGFVKSLSLALADRYPVFAQALTQIGQRHPEIHVQQIVSQPTGSKITAVRIETLKVGGLSAKKAFTHLVSEPLKLLVQSGESDAILVLVDALDEALTFDLDDNLVTLLADVTDDPRDLPSQVRFLVTSRSDPRVVDLIGRPVLDLVDDAPDSQHDVQDYAEHRLIPVLTEFTTRQDLAGRIAATGAGNFLYARYVLDELVAHPEVLADLATLSLPEGLDGVYAKFLKRELGRQLRTWRTYRPLLGALVMARGSGLTRKQLTGIINVRDSDVRASDVEELLEPCMQYLSGAFPDGPFRIYHQSFREYLLKSEDYRLEPDEVRADVARYFWAQFTAFQDKGTLLDDYTLANLPVHLAEVGRDTDLQSLLLNYGWMQIKLRTNGILDLINDYELFPLEDKRGEIISIVKSALRLSSKVVEEDEQQLASQLLGRLSGYKQDEITLLLKDAIKSRRGIWLKPLIASLELAGSSLVRILYNNNWIFCVAVTPDGKYAVSGTEDLIVWELESGKVVCILEGHSDIVWDLLITPNGQYIISGSDDKTLKVWELVEKKGVLTGKELYTLAGHTEGISTLAITPDGRFAISGSIDKTLKVWDLESRREVYTLEGHTRPVNFVAVSPDGQFILSQSDDQTIKVWDLQNGNEINTFYRDKKRVKSLSVTPDLQNVVSKLSSGKIKLYDLMSGKELFILDKEYDIKYFADKITPDGHYAVKGVGEKILRVWDLENLKEVKTFEGHAEEISDLAITLDGRFAISSSYDSTLRVWEIAPKSGAQLKRAHSGSVNDITTTLDGKYAISGSNDGVIKVWGLDCLSEERSLIDHLEPISSVAVTFDGHYVVSGSYDKTLKIWDLGSGSEISTLKGHKAWIRTVAITPDGHYAVSGSDDKTIKIWELSSGREVRTLKGKGGSFIFALTITPDGQYIISGDDEVSLKVWEFNSGKEVRDIQETWWTINTIKVTPNGRYIVVGTNDGWLRILDFESGEEVFHLAEGELGKGINELSDMGSINDVEVIDDGGLIITASSDNTIRVFNFVNRKVVTSFTADCNIMALSYSPRNRIIVAGDEAGQVHFLKLEGL